MVMLIFTSCEEISSRYEGWHTKM